MASGEDKQLAYRKIKDYVQALERCNIPIWRLYLYGSYAKNTYHAQSDIDLAVFWDRNDIDGFDEDVLLRKLSLDIDLRIEPHSFARSDFDETDPYIREIIRTGERIIKVQKQGQPAY
jgi:predicted nucleotidyltransferase